MLSGLNREPFIMSHLKEVNESYFTHMLHAIKYALKFFKAGFICLVHAFFPNILTKAASKTVEEIGSDIDRRRNIS